MLPQLLLFLLGLKVRTITALPQAMVASSPPPLQQAFPPEYQHIAHAAQVNAS
jgi:hypothetical protein